MNNYDTSSTGENIDFHVFRDTSLAQIYFDEWLKGYDGDEVNKIDLGGRDNYLYLIGDADKPYYSKLDLKAKSKKELFELMLDYDLLSYDAEVNDFKKSEYIADLLNVTHKRHYEYLASQYSWHKIQNYIQHDYFISRGYSQGDEVIIVKIDGLTKEYREYINHIFWDCPISISAVINGSEFYTDDFIGNGSDSYEWNREDIKERVMAWNDCSDYAKNWIIEHLPEYPDYL